MMTPLMQGMLQLSEHPLVHSLGWTLLHFCWQGATVALMLWCVLGLLGGRSSQARYTAACVALALMVALPVATFAHVAAAEYKTRTVILDSGIVFDAGIVIQAGAAESIAPWPTRIGMALDHSLPWVLVAWFAGMLVFAGRLNFGLLVARRLKTTGTEAPSPALLQLFEGLRIRLGVDRAVQLLHSAQVQVPTVIGWLRPVVLLPVTCLTGLSPDQIKAVLCHELAHIRRHDYLVSVIQSVIETVLFYHPAVWWVSKQVRRERECCCDQLVVEVGGDVLAYARALSILEESRAAFPEFVLGANGGVLKMRIQRILGSKRDAEGSPAAALVALSLILAVAGSNFVTASRAQAAQIQSQSQSTPKPSLPPAQIASPAPPAASVSVSQEGLASPSEPAAQPPHGVDKTWLEQDVRWIITDTEAEQFKQLTNDEERNKFIEQFWARRDPSGVVPGTYRQEIYTRIAYSNEHFAADKPGWMTDRGHIYIAYGQPESIESHPSGGSGSAYPYEVWHYKATNAGEPDVYLKFVDDSGNGQYRLVGQVPPAQDSPAELAAPQAPTVSSGAMQQALIYKVDPVYPPIAKAAHVQGTVALHARISKAGTVEDLRVISGAPMLIPSAIDAVRQWKYKPYLVAGEPTEVETTININFALAPPDLSCTYYNAGIGHPGTCEEGAEDKGHYYCREDENKELVQSQSGCEWKVKRLQDSQHDSPLPASIQISPSPEPPAVRNSQGLQDATSITSLPQGSFEYHGAAIRKVGGNVTSPAVIYKVSPDFTTEARKAKFQGIVVVNLIVDNKGKPQNVHVLRGVGMGLDQNAVAAVKKYKFKPATESGKPVPVAMNVEVNFQIF